MTNPIRRHVAASLLMCGEAWDRKELIDARGDRHVTFERATWLGMGCPEGQRMDRRDLSRWRDAAGVRARIVP
jgi:hypothetical protein